MNTNTRTASQTDFRKAFDKMMLNEGGYVLHTVEGDRGGMTYAGIARRFHPDWEGWKIIDAGGTPDANMVSKFYLVKFWQPMKGDILVHQEVAEVIFDFYVNAGEPALKLAQIVVGAVPDGVFGPKTLAALNSVNPQEFKLQYTLAKIARYAEICNKDKTRTQSKFLLGWINRALKGLK